MVKSACIFGITGQDGHFLTKLLLDKGYHVYGMKRRSSSFNTERIDPFLDNLEYRSRLDLTYGDLTDSSSVFSWIGDIKPDLIFHMGAMSHVKISSDMPEYTFNTIATGTLRVLEAVRKNSPKSRILQAATSELFGSTAPPQNLNSLMLPQSPYACAKLAAYHLTINYRTGYNMFACSSLSFNHESCMRNESFISRKLTSGLARCKLGLQSKVYVGNLKAKRDWSHASDICDGMYLQITADEPKEYIFASGEMRSVEEMLDIIGQKLDLDWREYLEFDARYLRPNEVDALCGDSSLARKELGWEPKYTFEQLIDEMIAYDLKLANQELLIKNSEHA